MCEKCEALIKEAHLAYMVSRGKDGKHMDMFAAGAAMFYEKIIERATKNSCVFMEKIKAGEPQIVSKADFSMAQLVGEKATIEFMLEYTGVQLEKLERRATKEIEHLQQALISIQRLSNEENIKEFSRQALKFKSEFTESSEKSKQKMS